MTDKDKIVCMLKKVGYEIDLGMWRGDDSDDVRIGVETEDGSVGFLFDKDGNFKSVWGRDW